MTKKVQKYVGGLPIASKKLGNEFLNGVNFLKNDPNWAYEVFLMSTFSVDVKKHLICPIWIIFEEVMAI